MLHLVMDEAIKRNRKIGLLLVDLEAQYALTMNFALACFEQYKDHIEPYWCALPLALRNAVSVYEPKWLSWDQERKEACVAPPGNSVTAIRNWPAALAQYPWWAPFL